MVQRTPRTPRPQTSDHLRPRPLLHQHHNAHASPPDRPPQNRNRTHVQNTRNLLSLRNKLRMDIRRQQCCKPMPQMQIKHPPTWYNRSNREQQAVTREAHRPATHASWQRMTHRKVGRRLSNETVEQRSLT